LARASRWNQIDAYLRDCERELCVLVQAESTTAVANLAEIAAVEGVDGVFFGPSDLSASMGLIGQANDPRVKDAVANGIRTVRQAGKAAGVLATDATVGVGVDTSLLVRAASTLAAQYKQAAKSTGPASGGGY
jgi:4-hydroxy-2-oxoheptanedioate aldolase